MPDANAISPKVELIRRIGTLIVKLDEARSTLNRESPERKKLDSCRDCLDTYQRSLVRNGISANTAAFQNHTASLKKTNDELEKTLDDVTEIADTLKNLVKFVEVVEKLVNLIPK